MIRLERENEPQILVDNRQTWTNQYVRWRENPIGQEPRQYAHPDIRSTLEAESHSKCAYCEARITHVTYTHIEHKLPKKLHPILVCAWDNLTIACPKCNTNKGEYNQPECPLLDPHIDDVEENIAFGGPMAFPRGGTRADATINRLRLNRSELLYERAQLLDRLYDLLDLVQRAAKEPATRVALWIDIDNMTAADGQFASACRQLLTTQLADRGMTRP